MRFFQGTKIYCGFPGVGKSNIFMNEEYKNYKISDSDSSFFSWMLNKNGEKVRNPDFPANYISHIKDLIKLNYDYIFVSTHKDVIDALNKANLKFAIVYPDISLKQDYLTRYKQRDSDNSFIRLMTNNWNTFINDLENASSTVKFKLCSPSQYMSNILDEEKEDYYYYSHSSNYFSGCLQKWTQLENLN